MKSELKVTLVLLLVVLAVALAEVMMIISIDTRLQEMNTLVQSQQDVIESQKLLIDEFDWDSYKRYLLKKEIKRIDK